MDQSVKITNRQRGAKKFEDCKKSETRMLFVTSSVQLVQWIPNPGSSWSGDFTIGGQIIHTVEYADDLVLLAKE